MENKIGKTIGIVKHSLSITNNANDKVSLTIKINFSNVSDNDISNWLCSNRCIAGQRPWRGLSLDELKALDGMTFDAGSIGKKVKSRTDRKQEMINGFIEFGMTIEQATKTVEDAFNSTKAMELIDSYKDNNKTEPDDSLDEYLKSDKDDNNDE